MGADIHFVIERQVTRYDRDNATHVPTGEWVGVYATDHTPKLVTSGERLPEPGIYDRWNFYDRRVQFKNRNYHFFAALAGVRGDGPEPKGVPADASRLTKLCVEGWGADGHSHSWDTLEAFARTWLAANYEEGFAKSIAEALENSVEYILHVVGLYDKEELDTYRVIYWFDN